MSSIVVGSRNRILEARENTFIPWKTFNVSYLICRTVICELTEGNVGDTPPHT